jgi:hypothetical protein
MKSQSNSALVKVKTRISSILSRIITRLTQMKLSAWRRQLVVLDYLNKINKHTNSSEAVSGHPWIVE